ncbi:MAG: hypothetical protein ACWGOY_12500 [Anaerolineales bacterium]
MDKMDVVTKNNGGISNLAVDGVIIGLLSGITMYVSLAALALFTGGTPVSLLERFSASGLTSPLQGLMSHLAVSAIYGALFGAVVWPVITRFTSHGWIGWIGGLTYGSFLFLLAQTAILPSINSPLGEIPNWQWALGHAVYGLVLGALFARKVG